MEAQQLRATIASAQAGDPEAYQAILDAYGPRLYGYFYRATRRHHDAEDLLGEIMLRLVKQLKRYDDRGRFEPWLFRIAANMVRDRIRRRKSKPPPVSLSAENEAGQSRAQRLEGHEAPVDEPLLHAEASEEVRQALDDLDEKTREMILLRFFGEMSFKELAEHFDCPLGTVLARVHRGLKALRAKMVNDDDRDE